MSLHLNSFIYFVSFCLSCMLLIVLMVILYRYYLLWHQNKIDARGQSKSVASSARLVIGSDHECDPEYMPPGTSTPSCAARAARTTPKKVASGVVTAS